MPLCGTKLSSFGIVVSLWGIAQLSLTGFLFHQRALAFIEDVKLPKPSYSSAEELFNDLELGYDRSAINCWVAALLYLATFVVSAQQYYMNVRVSEVPSERFTNFASITN
jgi:hypothetical protein